MGQEATTFPETSTALVACETSADPGRLKRKVLKRWRKQYAKWQRKLQRKKSLAGLQTVLEQALRESGADVTMGALRTIVEARLGVGLQGKNSVHFDKALFALTHAPKQKPRARRRFKMANCRAKRD